MSGADGLLGSTSLPPMPSPEEGSLRERLVATLGRAVGTPERLVLGALVARAKAYALDGPLAAALARAVEDDPNGIERNLDLVDPPSEGVWVEWEEASRLAGRGGEGADSDAVKAFEASRVTPVRVGGFLCPAPDDPDRLTMMTAWSLPDGTVRHSYAAVAMGREAMAGQAWLARSGRLSVAPRESSYRLLMGMEVYVPPGLSEEVDFVAGQEGGGAALAERVRAAARLDVTSDAIFVVAAVLATVSRGVVSSPRPDGFTVLGAPVGGVSGGSLGARLSALVAARRRPGFGRVGRTPKASVRFAPAVSAAGTSTRG